MSEKIIILGGDGFCGWPTALYLSKLGYDITIVDNLSRRDIEKELGAYSLTPIRPMRARLRAWKKIAGREIRFVHMNVARNYNRLLALLTEIKPHAVVHFAEQRAAPYSMKSAYHKRYTVNNNINATNNLLCAIVESGLDIHVVHLGTMGVYGYGQDGFEIPEGYLKVFMDVDGKPREMEILYPANPGSIYHMTKTQDALLFYYYNKNDRLRITDLHQGIVWGTSTTETLLNDALINRFDYDGDYGTALNRFLMQAAVGFPLTVYGSGGQTRAFIHIRDTVKCIELAIKNPPLRGDRVQIFNQATETYSLKCLAEKVSAITGAKILCLANPRIEPTENQLRVSNKKFLSLGLSPTTLENGLMKEVIHVAEKYKGRCDTSKILCRSKWRSDIELDSEVDSFFAEMVSSSRIGTV